MDKSQFSKLANYTFGSSAAIITNASLIAGLGSAGAGKAPILGGLLTFALADNISDSLAIHLYQESEGAGRELPLFATVMNFLARLATSLSFVAIVLAFPVRQSVPVAIVWGLLLLVLVSYLITRSRNQSSLGEIVKHVLIAVIVIALSRLVGYLISEHF
jgi:VIT1/CCC1 family predicted Fe2+/Mn2+ transporter